MIGETLTNHDILRRPSSIIVLSFDPRVSFHILVTTWQLREAISHFSLENVVPIMHEQIIICSKTRLDGTAHEQTIICRQLFAGHVVGCRPMEGKKKLHRMIMLCTCTCSRLFWRIEESILLLTKNQSCTLLSEGKCFLHVQ